MSRTRQHFIRVLARVAVLVLAASSVLVVGGGASGAAAAPPTLARYPYLTDMTATSVAVNWATTFTPTSPQPTPGVVTYGPAGGTCDQTTVTVSAPTYSYVAFGEVPPYRQYSAQLTGLSPSTAYCYRVYAGSVDVANDLVAAWTTSTGLQFPMTFTTSPAAGSSTPFSFDVVGDFGETKLTNSTSDLGPFNPNQAALDQQLANSATGPNPALFAIANGDIAYNSGTPTNYGDLNHSSQVAGVPDISDVFGRDYFAQAGSSLPIYSVIGNHGRNQTFFQTWPTPTNVSNSSGTYQWNLQYSATDGIAAGPNPSGWYAFTVGGVRFYILDGDWNDLTTTQYPDLGHGCAPKACPAYQADRDEHWRQNSAEYTWLKNDLAKDAKTRGASAMRLAFFHFPLRVDQNNSLTQSDVYLQNSPSNPLGAANSLEALLEANNVNLAFNAHAHMYERNIAPPGGVASYVSGGGGGVPTNVASSSAQLCSGFDAYARGWAPSTNAASACGAPSGGGTAKPSTVGQVYHFLKVSVNGTNVTVDPTDSTGAVFDPMTYHFAQDTTPPTKPGTPTATVHATAGYTQVAIDESAVDNVGVVAYDVYHNGAYQFSVPNGVTTWRDYNVLDVNGWTEQARDQRGNTSLDVTPPTTPGPPTASVSPHAVRLSWAPSADNLAVTGYDVFRDGTQIATGVSGPSYTDTQASDLTPYSYTVAARDAAGNASPQSPATAVSTPDWTAPSSPTASASAGRSAGSVVVRWTSSHDNLAVSGYDVYRDGSPFRVAINVQGTSWTDARRSPGSLHSYRIAARDAAGNRSALSNAATARAGQIRPSINIHAPQTVHPNQSFTIWGSVSPSVRNSIHVQQYVPSTQQWHTVRVTQTALHTLRNGTRQMQYRIQFRETRGGNYRFRAYWAASTTYATAVSPVVMIQVRR
jgi:hypothetical protein